MFMMIGILFWVIMLLDLLFFGMFTGFILLCANLWYITIPVLLIWWYLVRKEEKEKQAIQNKYDDVVFMINRNNVRYDQAKTTNEYKEVYETYVQAINIIEEQMMVELFEIRDKIKRELPNIESKFRG